MTISRRDVARIAALARLQLEPAELERMTGQLNSILQHMQELRAVAVADVEPFVLAAEHAAPPRADEPGADTLAVPAADLAIAWRGGFFTVPRLEAQRADSARSPAEHG
jgi:aspartyl-tRNA(Asn)/glutamyl-tRNA(Gln) amidotransferase subunit C